MQRLSLTGRALNILFAEDNELNRFLFTRQLTPFEDKIIFAENGQQAVEIIKSQPVDIVFMDIRMPVMNGYDATIAIRALEVPLCSIPIIAITAADSEEDFGKCIEAGMNDLISKPFETEELIKKINKWLLEEKTTHESKRNNAQVLPPTDPDYKKKMLNIFLRQKEEFVSQIKLAISEKNHDSLSFILHKMKSSFNVLSIESLNEKLNALEVAAQGNNYPLMSEKADALFAALDDTENSLRKNNS
ncbi:MAG: response regulator [Cytophagaceae bacterium]